MRLQVQGRVQTGVVTFDHSLGAATLWHNAPGGPVLVVNSGQQGGISTWRLLPTGQVVGLDTLAYSSTGTRAARDHVVIAPFRGEMVAFYGLGDTTFWGQAVNADGSFGARRLVNFDTASAEIAAGNTEFLRLWALMRPDAPPNLPDLPAWQGTTGIAQAGSDLVMISSAEAGLRVLTPSGASALIGADLGIMAPTGLAVFGSGTDTRIVVAGAGGSSLSVLRMTAQGYVASEHMLDTGHTAFARVQAMAGVTVPTANGPLDLVLAGGGDHGVTLFALTPDGALVWLDTVFDSALTGLHNVATLAASLVGGQVVITATSQRDAGITVLTLPVAGLGGIAPAGQGGAGADILISSATAPVLTGGAGTDVFVIRPQTAPVTITDFTPGQDRLDLSAWPMLRDISQLGFQTIAGGGVISYRGYQVQITSTGTDPLTLATLFPRGLEGADRVLALGQEALFGITPPPPPPPPPEPEAPPPSPEPVVPPPPPSGGVTIVRLETPAGLALTQAQVRVTLADGSIVQTSATTGQVVLEGTSPPIRLDATRPYDPQTGDPQITASDALNALRLAVGVSPSFGPARPIDFIKADINRDGQVTAADALDILRIAVGLPSATGPEWLFFDPATDWDTLNLSRSNTTISTGLTLPPDWDGGNLALSGILLGAVTGQT